MKRTFLLYCLLSALILPAGCSEWTDSDIDYPIVDWYPVNVIILLQDKDGNDLLDPDRSGNYFEGATLSFQGVTYEARQLENGEYWSATPTKAFFARIKGFRLVHDSIRLNGTDTQRWFLVFGQIDGADDMEEDLVVTWPNGETDTIHYHCSNHKIEKQRDGEWIIDCQRSWKLNGKTAQNPFHLVK